MTGRRRQRSGGRIVDALVAAVLVAGAGLTAAYFHANRSVQAPSGTTRVSGGLPTAPVAVQVDSFGVPYVAGEGLADVFFAQGYLHGVDRLFQLELLRRTARGRLAEAFGPAALETDRLSRTLDLWGAAARSAAGLTPGERELLRAYAAGVNAAVDAWSGPWPLEFRILGIRPGRWTPTASLAVGKLMALDLSSWRRELSRYLARQVVDDERFRYLEPRVPAWAPTILPDSVPLPGGVRPGSPPTRPAASGGSGAGAGAVGVARRPTIALHGRGPTGSNAWLVTPERSASGAALLANDMHLSLRVPSTWYLVSLRAPAAGYEVAGLSLPGVPGVVVGYNPALAWGFTNGMVDDMDFVVEDLSPDGERYRDGSRWHRLEVREERIPVRGRDTAVVLRVRSTARGPLLSDVLPGTDRDLAAVWVAARRASGVRGLLAMNRARTSAAFDTAVQAFGAVHQNVIWATVSGEAGYRLTGPVPVRARGRAGGLPVPADSLRAGGSLWSGYWPSGRLPGTRTAAGAYLATANNLQAPGLLGAIGADYPIPFRARRIVDRLAGERSWTVAGMAELQRDTRSLFADRVLERALAAAARAGEDSAAARLRRWDRRVDEASAGATLFYVWLYRLRDLVAADEYRGRPAAAYFPDRALLEVLEDGGGAWVDDVTTAATETLEALEEKAMREAVRVAGGRAWGAVHREVSEHPLGRVGWLDGLLGFDVGPYPAPGAPHTVRPDDYERWEPLHGSAWRPPFRSARGPSERFVAELDPERGPRGYFLLPTGQSGDPFSDHYRDMTPRWRNGGLLEVPLDPGRIADRATRSFRLVAETPAR